MPAKKPGPAERGKQDRAAYLRGLGARVREARLRRNLTQREVALRSGYGEVSLSELETGQREPGAYSLARLARTLGVTVGALAEESPPSGEAGERPSRAARTLAEMDADLLSLANEVERLRVLVEGDRRSRAGRARPRSTES